MANNHRVDVVFRPTRSGVRSTPTAPVMAAGAANALGQRPAPGWGELAERDIGSHSRRSGGIGAPAVTDQQTVEAALTSRCACRSASRKRSYCVTTSSVLGCTLVRLFFDSLPQHHRFRFGAWGIAPIRIQMTSQQHSLVKRDVVTVNSGTGPGHGKLTSCSHCRAGMVDQQQHLHKRCGFRSA
jgi:hypothetical protein